MTGAPAVRVETEPTDDDGPWWLRLVPGWVAALAVYGLTRVVATVFTLAAAPSQLGSLWAPQDPPYGDFVSMWDGDRYRVIAEQGYPLPLPLDEAGEPAQSEWAFFPAYPALARLVMTVTGLGFRDVAPTVSLLCGFAAAVLVYRLFRRRAGRPEALLGVAVLGVFPTAPVLQYSYSEGLCLLALAASLYLLATRRYLAAVPAVALLGLTRPVGVPFALVVLAHLVVRWRARDEDPFPPVEVAKVVLVGAVTTLAALAMPAATAVAAGRADGYTAVQVAWRVQDQMEYFTPWAWMARYVLHGWGPVVLLLLVIGHGVGAREPSGAGARGRAVDVVRRLRALPGRGARPVHLAAALPAAVLPAGAGTGHEHARLAAGAAADGLDRAVAVAAVEVGQRAVGVRAAERLPALTAPGRTSRDRAVSAR